MQRKYFHDIRHTMLDYKHILFPYVNFYDLLVGVTTVYGQILNDSYRQMPNREDFLRINIGMLESFVFCFYLVLSFRL